jgi:hypothetical protein
MGLLFIDSFNHYDTLTNKWDFVGDASIVTTSHARTGTQSMKVFGGATGPSKNLGPQQTLVTYTKLIQGIAINSDGFRRDNAHLMYFSVIGESVLAQNIIVAINLDGSISVSRGAGDGVQTLLGTSAPVFVYTTGADEWNYLEAKWFGDTVNGSIEIRFAPPGGPMAVVLSLTGINTVAYAAAPFANQVQLLADVGISFDCYMNDYYVADWSDGSTYLGGVKIYHDMPFADGSPVQWTPLANLNYEEVNEVPPDGNASYNSSGGVGQIDQYKHNLSAVPSNSSVLAVQHIMTAKTDTSRALSSVVEGTAHANPVYLGGDYSMFTYMYPTNPATGRSWAHADFPASFGPKVVA